MRVISGKLKGRVIKGYDIEGTRPTMDRVKESIFGSIQDYVDGSIVLDLFAGSGNLGIESISNGASKCYFVDNNKKCIKVIQDNLKEFKVEMQGIIVDRDYKDALRYFRDNNIKFNIIFVDPPYQYQIMNDILYSVKENNLLLNGGIIVLEYQLDSLENVEGYKLLKYKKYGDKYVSIYQFLLNN